MSRVRKVCDTSEFWGAKKSYCYYELEEVDTDSLYYSLKRDIENGLDYIPEDYEYIHLECLDEECYDAIEIEFEIDPRDYLDKKDIEELEKLIEEQYEGE